MSTAVPASMIQPLRFSGQQYSEHQRNDWESSAFARLFDGNDGARRATTDARQATLPHSSSQFPQSAEDSIRLEQLASSVHASGPSAAEFSTASEALSAGHRLAVLDSAELDIGLNIAASTPRMTADAVDGRVQAAASNDSPSLLDLTSISALSEDCVVVAGLHAGLMRVVVRSARLHAWQLPNLLSRVRAELSWHGMGLDSLTVNGRPVYRAAVGGQSHTTIDAHHDA